MILRSIRWNKTLFFAPALLLAGATSAFGAEGGVDPQPTILFNAGPLPVTNSMVTTWFFSIVLILVIRWVAGKPKLIPTRGQAAVETMVVGLRDTFELIVGKSMINRVFPLLISFFIFILIMNWSGLLPGAGSFGRVNEDGSFSAFFRPADSDLNTTLALTIVSFIAWLYFVLRYAGAGVLLKDIFGNKADRKDVPLALFLILYVVFFLVGFIEIISILSRLLSLSFRLYGNVIGGENLLDSMYGIFANVLPVPFYLMEMLVGVIQAFVFTVLTAVYIGLICNHEGGEHDHADDDHGEEKPASAH